MRRLKALFGLAILLPSMVFTASAAKLSSGEPFVLTGIVFSGNIAFSHAQLAPLAADLMGKSVAIEDLELLRVAITRTYVNAGFINSGAAIDDQETADGTLTIRIIEGSLTSVEIEGNKRLRDKTLTARLLHAGRAPLDLKKLQNEILLLNQDANVKRLNAELKPGALPGTSWLHLTVEEAPAFHADLMVSNHRAPSVGAEHLTLSMRHTNLTGRGDELFLFHTFTDGEFDQLTVEPNNTDIGYSIPLSGSGTRLHLSASRSDNTLVEEPSDELSITSESTTFSIKIRQPISRTLQHETGVFAGMDWSRAETWLLGEPFSFDAGANDGVTRLAVFRLGADHVQRSTNQVLAGRITLSLGSEILGAKNVGQPNPTFAVLLTEGSWVKRFGDSGWQLITQGSLQWTNEHLPSLERFSVGGRYTVRGFRENQLVRDRGATASIEIQKNLKLLPKTVGTLTASIFVDGGWAEHTNDMDLGPNHIASAGVGLLASLNDRIDAELYYAHGFRKFDIPEDDLQDDGIHFRIVLKLR